MCAICGIATHVPEPSQAWADRSDCRKIVGFLAGPALGSVMLIVLGPTLGMFANVAAQRFA